MLDDYTLLWFIVCLWGLFSSHSPLAPALSWAHAKLHLKCAVLPSRFSAPNLLLSFYFGSWGATFLILTRLLVRYSIVIMIVIFLVVMAMISGIDNSRCMYTWVFRVDRMLSLYVVLWITTRYRDSWSLIHVRGSWVVSHKSKSIEVKVSYWSERFPQGLSGRSVLRYQIRQYPRTNLHSFLDFLPLPLSNSR